MTSVPEFNGPTEIFLRRIALDLERKGVKPEELTVERIAQEMEARIERDWRIALAAIETVREATGLRPSKTRDEIEHAAGLRRDIERRFGGGISE